MNVFNLDVSLGCSSGASETVGGAVEAMMLSGGVTRRRGWLGRKLAEEPAVGERRVGVGYLMRDTGGVGRRRDEVRTEHKASVVDGQRASRSIEAAGKMTLKRLETHDGTRRRSFVGL